MSFGIKMTNRGLIQQPQTEVDMDMWATTSLYEAPEVKPFVGRKIISLDACVRTRHVTGGLLSVLSRSTVSVFDWEVLLDSVVGLRSRDASGARDQI